MPELPEVETIRRGLLSQLQLPAQVEKIFLGKKKLRFPLSSTVQRRLTGSQIVGVDRRGKHLIFKFTHGELWAHLGMTGNFRIEKLYKPQKHDHLILYLDGKNCLIYQDARRFGFFEWTDDKSKSLRDLGPEPSDESLTTNYLLDLFRDRKSPIKTILMDQSVVAGLGNIYASEVLFVAGIHPELPARRLTEVQIQRLIQSIRQVIQLAIEHQGTTLRDYKKLDGETGGFQNRLKVYGRKGQKCQTCDTIVKSRTLAGRSTYWCPSCQTKR